MMTTAETMNPPKTREAIIRRAAGEFDSRPDLIKMTDRESYISMVLQDAGMPRLKSGEDLPPDPASPEQTRAGAEYRGNIMEIAAKSWDSSKELQGITSSRDSYVNGQLLTANKAPLSPTERDLISRGLIPGIDQVLVANKAH